MSPRRKGQHRWVGIALGIITVAVGASVWSWPLHASAQNNDPCGSLWSDGSQDANGPPPVGGSQDNNLDLVSGNMSDNGSSLSTILQVKTLSSTPASNVPSVATAVDYYMV